MEGEKNNDVLNRSISKDSPLDDRGDATTQGLFTVSSSLMRQTRHPSLEPHHNK